MHPALDIAVWNLVMSGLGFIAGWNARQLLNQREGVAMRRPARTTATAALVTLATAILGALIIVPAELYSDTPALQDVWNGCRHLNYPLGVLVAVGVIYRLSLFIFDRHQRRDAPTVHIAAVMIYTAANLIAAALTSHHYEVVGVDATWVSGLRTLLMLAALALTTWWPHQQHHAEEATK